MLGVALDGRVSERDRHPLAPEPQRQEVFVVGRERIFRLTSRDAEASTVPRANVEHRT